MIVEVPESDLFRSELDLQAAVLLFTGSTPADDLKHMTGIRDDTANERT
jgi:hypothetical protein